MKTPLFAAVVLALAACASTTEPSSPSASVTLRPASGTKVSGSLKFTQAGDRVRVTGEVTGHSAGAKGFHIHEKGDCSAPDATSAGGHFNPAKARHGAPGAGHAGDLGNLVFNESGKAAVDLTVSGISVSKEAPNSIIGRAVIVHAATDDLKTDPTGNAGGRGACGVIQ
jgi:Cu-Zn family superoxide dismutase